jgi:NAD kinase
MNLDKVLFVPSKSRYEIEIARAGSESLARSFFGSAEVWDYITESYAAQKANLERVVTEFGSEKIIDRSLLEDFIKDNDLFVFLGGDNHFTYCAQELLRYLQQHPDERKYVAGVVLDSKKSLGALLYFDVDRFLGSLQLIKRGDCRVERWTTLEARVDAGSSVALPYPAIGDYFVGEYGRLSMSRNRVYIDCMEIFPDKSSGILVSVGAGSGPGSWYNNVHRVMFGEADRFGKQDGEARVILTEHESRSKATLSAGQMLVIDSYNDARGIVSPDAHEEHSVDFRIGSRAEIRISDIKLDVIAP